MINIVNGSSGKKIMAADVIIWLNGPGSADPKAKGASGLKTFANRLLAYSLSGGGNLRDTTGLLAGCDPCQVSQEGHSDLSEK